MRSRKTAFTLIELLVVVSIIALLVSILLPALSQARAQAKKVMCRSNLHQMSIAMVAYALDHDDQFPTTSTVGSGCWNSWGTYGVVNDLGAGNWNPVGWGLLWEAGYAQNWELYYCPGRKRNEWPAWNIFNRSPDWPFEFPQSSCYQLRGWRSPDPADWQRYQSTNWRLRSARMALMADMFLNYPYAIAPHKTVLNVGYSDGSTVAIGGNDAFPESIINRGGLPFFPWLEDRTASVSHPMGEDVHLRAFEWFDTR